MIPGMNPRQMRQAMQRMGISQEDVDAEQVIIRLKDRDLVFNRPGVAMVTMGGQDSWQITGDFEQRSRDSAPDISDEDVETVKDATGASEAKIREILKKNKGDLAKTILELKE